MPKKAHHEEHENLEAWVIPYADLLTLLLAMFLALYATSNTDLQKLKSLATAFRSQAGVGGAAATPVDPGVKKGSIDNNILAMGGAGLLQGSGLTWPVKQVLDQIEAVKKTAGDKALEQQQAVEQAQQAEQQQFDQTKQQIQQALQGTGLEKSLQFQQTARGLQLTVLTDGVLFGSGSADLAAPASQLIQTLGEAMKKLDNEIEITGHTDSIGNDRSNFLLSTQRANNVADYLVSKLGIPSNRILVSGRGSTKPIADNASVDGRAKNRRVEITILSKSSTSGTDAPTSTAAGVGAQATPTSSTIATSPSTPPSVLVNGPQQGGASNG